MKKSIFKTIALLSLVAIMITGCNSEHPGFKQYDSGLYYKTHISNPDSIKPIVGDMVTVEMVYRTKNDSIFSDSRLNPTPMMFPVNEFTYAGDIYEALTTMNKGDSTTFVFGTDSFFIKTAIAPIPEFLDSGSFFYMDLKLIEVKSKEEYEGEMQAEKLALMKEENTILKAYLLANNITAEPTQSGLYYIEKAAGNGESPVNTDIVSIRYSATFLGDTTPFFSRGFNGEEPNSYQVGAGQMGNGIDEGLRLMKVGGKATLICPSHLAFGEGRGGQIPPFKTIIFEVELTASVSKDEFDAEQKAKTEKLENEEEGKRNKYIKDNNISVAPTNSGLYYIELEKGTGKKAEAGKTVAVHYKGMLLDGTVFDDSYSRGKPIEFPLGQGRVIPGWDEGISLMNEGGKAKLVIPSKIGYGEGGSGQRIPPYSTLVFEVELVEVK